jgi:hypothetical protein
LGYPFVIRPPKIFLTLAVISVVVLGLAASPAMAKKPAKKPACWKVLVNDWYDGTVDGKYGLHCYREALRHLKTETYALGYTSAYDDINRAYQQRRAELAGRDVGPYKSGGDDAMVLPTGRPGGGGSGPGSIFPHGVGHDRWYPPPGQPVRKTTDGEGPVQDLINKLGPDEATSIPIPLIILAGIAVLLMAAGGVSLIARRAQGRRATVPVRPAPPTRGP